MLLQMNLSPGQAVPQAQALPLTPCALSKFSVLLGPQFSDLHNDRIGPEGFKDTFQLKDPLIHSLSSIY